MSTSDNQETMKDSIMKDLKIMISELLEERLQQEQEKKERKKSTESHENEIKQTTATPARRALYYDGIPELTSPLTAVKRSAVRPSKTALDEDNMVPDLDLPTGSSTYHNLDVNVALQKGMAKPPIFTGTNNDDLRTWWRQMKNFASAFPSEARSRVIKSYLRGSAATWLESQERDMGRELTIEELADGLVQEYGSETTSAAALQKIESLAMGVSEGCDTVSSYNAKFSIYYNLLSVRDQISAVRSYIKGIAPRYLKYIMYGDTNFKTLAEAKAAVTQAVAKHDQLELAYANHQQHKKAGNRNKKNYQRRGANENNRSNDDRKVNDNNNQQSSRNKFNKNNNRRWEDQNPYRYALSSLADTTLDDEDNYDNNSSEGEIEGKDHQIAAVAAVSNSDAKGERKLSNEEMAQLRKEGRCFRCRGKGHRQFECKSNAANPPKPLNG